MGDPKTNFLLLFLSAVRPSQKKLLLTLPLSDCPTKTTSPDFAPVQHPTSDLGPVLYSWANPIQIFTL